MENNLAGQAQTSQSQAKQPNEAAYKIRQSMEKSFKTRGVITAISSGFTYGIYTAFMTLAMSVGIWGVWYGDNSGLSAFAVIFLLGALGAGITDGCSGIWALSICIVRGKFQDYLRCLKSKPGVIMTFAAILGGPVAATCYVIGLQQAGPIIVPISALCPAFGSIISHFLFGQKLTPRVILGILICFAASAIIGSTGLSLEGQANVPLGLLFGFIAAICWGFEGCICGYGTSLVDYEIAITIRQTTSGIVNLLLLVPLFAFIGGADAFAMIGQNIMNIESFKWFIIAGFFAYFNYMLWYKGNGMCGTALGMVCNGMFAFWGPFFCWLVLGVMFGIEGWSMPIIAWFAAILMVVGIFIIAVNPLDYFRKKGA